MRRALKGCGKLISNRVKKLDVETQKSTFCGCSEIFDCVKYTGSDEDFGNDVEYRMISERNFAGWCILSVVLVIVCTRYLHRFRIVMVVYIKNE